MVTDGLRAAGRVVRRMASLPEEADRPTGGRLDERVLEALQGFQGRVAFSGLRRALHAHPESLSRSLRRLEREGLVDRSSKGYRALGPAALGRPGAEPELRPIARVELPPGTPVESVLGRLTGRWFGSLRWVGVVESPSGRMLAWARRDGDGHVLLRSEGSALQVYVRGLTSDDPTESEDSAYELLVHAVDALRPSGHANPVATALLAAPQALSWSPDAN